MSGEVSKYGTRFAGSVREEVVSADEAMTPVHSRNSKCPSSKIHPSNES
jgi:hypothetical protein